MKIARHAAKPGAEISNRQRSLKDDKNAAHQR
jgi:hypothetical protein